MKSIEEAVNKFVENLTVIIEAEVRESVLASVNGVPTKAAKNSKYGKIGKKSRRKGPIQLCPAPKCKNRAAPVYGMLCGDHKGAPKKTVAKWREARRAKAKSK